MNLSVVQPVRVIACRVFKPSLEYLNLEEKYSNLEVTFLESSLHIAPNELRNRLQEEIRGPEKRNERVLLLYGECFRDIRTFCRRRGVSKVQCDHCYEIFLGRERFRKLIYENAGSYFLEQDLILNFEEYCVRPMELHEPEMRELFFKNYERLVYVRQPNDPDLAHALKEIAGFLKMSVTVEDADYTQLKNDIIHFIKKTEKGE